jgi:hypothetical protein
MMTKMRGLCIYDRPVDDVLEIVAREYFLDSIATDLKQNFKNIMEKTGSW